MENLSSALETRKQQSCKSQINTFSCSFKNCHVLMTYEGSRRMNSRINERPVIAITGSAGKTTTKELIASILGHHWKVFKSKGNMNLYPHTARYATQIDSSYEAVVLEYGLKGPGDITKHCNFIQPNIGVVTNVGTAHLGSFNGKVELLAKAKSELIQGIKKTGMLFINSDDQNSKLLLTQGFTGRLITVGYKQKSDYFASNIKFSDTGMTFEIKLDSINHKINSQILGFHNIYNILFAIAVAHQLGFRTEEIKKSINSFSHLSRRLRVFSQSTSGITIIDDTFSATGEAMKAAIDVMEQIGKGSKIVVFGRIRWLGNYSAEIHRNIGKYIANKNIDLLLTFGDEADQIGIGAIQFGFPKEKVIHLPTRELLHQQLLNTLQPDTTILIKGSNDLDMGKTVQFLLRNFK